MSEESGNRTPFTDLPRESPPPSGLEEALFARLRRAGAFERHGSRRWLLPLAAALVGVVLGFVLGLGGGARQEALADTRPVFMFIFSGGPQSGEGLRRTIEANSEWARSTLRGRMVGAQKLLAQGSRIGPDGAPQPQPEPRSDDFSPTGFFLVRAGDFAEAVELATTCPLLEMGASVTVRPVDDLHWIARSAAVSPLDALARGQEAARVRARAAPRVAG